MLNKSNLSSHVDENSDHHAESEKPMHEQVIMEEKEPSDKDVKSKKDGSNLKSKD